MRSEIRCPDCFYSELESGNGYLRLYCHGCWLAYQDAAGKGSDRGSGQDASGDAALEVFEDVASDLVFSTSGGAKG